MFDRTLHKDFTFIDLFSGIGGLRLPFSQLGGKCVFSSEWDKYAQQTYYTNFNEMPYGDITTISPITIPSHDILLAGFPCQPFSQAGFKKGFEDTRGSLFFYICKILEYHKPKSFLLENVKNLVSHDKGRTFKVILSSLKSLGYSIYWKVLNSRDYNLPQNRERIYIVGFKENIDFEFPNPIPLTKTIHTLLEECVDNKYTISEKLWEGHKNRKIKNTLSGKGFGYSLITKDNIYTRTLTARYYKDGAEILIEQVGKNPRKLTPRECARLQGFPDSFIIPVSNNQAYKQFGNSVSIPVISKIAENMLISLEQKKLGLDLWIV